MSPPLSANKYAWSFHALKVAEPSFNPMIAGVCMQDQFLPLQETSWIVLLAMTKGNELQLELPAPSAQGSVPGSLSDMHVI